MTVNNTTAGVLRYGNDVTQEFDFPFEAQDASHVRVAQVFSTAAVDLNPLDYSVVLSPMGGTVTLNYIPDSTVTLYIYRKTPRDQLVSVSSQSRYDPEVTEEVWDKLTMAAQEMQTEIDRAIKTTPGQDPQALLVSIALSEQNAVAAASAASDDAAAAAASAAEADADAAQAAADRVQTGLDRAQTGLDRAQTTADAAATAADRLATGADRVQTGLDAAATAADRVQTGLDAAATAADRGQTGLDAAATAADRVQTGLDRAAAAASAAEAASYVPTIATQAEAEAGTDNIKLMTPLRVAQSIANLRKAPVKTTGALTGLSTFEINSIPTGVEWIEGFFGGISLFGSDNFLIQLGHSGAWRTSGYSGGAFIDPATASVASASGFMLRVSQAARSLGGSFRLRRVTEAVWAFSAVYAANEPGVGAGSIDLTADLTRLRLFPSGTNTFDKGTLTVEYGY